MKKICKSCGLERDAEKDFNWEYKSRGKRQARCKYCQSELSKLHYLNNKGIYNERTRARKAQVLTENMSRISSHLSMHPCVDCGNPDIRVLEFDHVRGHKTEEISHLLSQGCGWPRIESEIAKCEVRCANCHRIKTLERGKWWRRNC
jgi:hypothetical protein